MHTVEKWKHPSNYFGATWEDYYSAGFGQSRDSDTLEESNFAVASEELLKLNSDYGDETTVQIVRENHWAVGWVEWIAIHWSNIQAYQRALQLCEQTEDYPVLDEDHWSNLEYEKATSYWDSESIHSRLDWLKRYAPKVPCFAARHDLSTIMHEYDSQVDSLYEALSR